MPVTSQPLGRRERNKQQKLDRITAAASELFAEYGVEEVTTQQIADKADIGTGTLFLYAKTKGELLPPGSERPLRRSPGARPNPS
jgi:AcrR family transcriptional regulator